MSNRQRAILFWTVTVAAALLTRFLTLGVQSPWLDEIMNWQLAELYGLRPRPFGGHQLSYVMQAAGLRLSDSIFGLRIYSALFGSLAMIAGIAYARRLGPVHAGVAAFLLLLSPFCLFYSQDANHYAPLMLGGIIAAFAADSYLQTNFSPARLVVAGVIVLTMYFYHPLGAVCTATYALLILLHVFHQREAISQRLKLHPKLVMWLSLFGMAAVVALCLHKGLDIVARMAGVQPFERWRPGLNIMPWLGLFADFFGAIYHHRPVDMALGVTGVVLSAAGYLLIARRRPFASIGALILVPGAISPFLIFDYTHYFSPRYLAAAVPVLLLGIAILAGECWATRARRARLILLICAGCWLAVYGTRAAQFQFHRGISHQQSYEAVEWMRRSLPEDAIVVTRHRYSSRTMQFLWKRFDMPQRLVPTDYFFRGGPAAVQQMEELAWENESVYFTTMLNDELHTDRYFVDWLSKNSGAVIDFPSGSPDEYIPFSWDIPVRKINRPADNPFLLPRDGSRASVVIGSERMTIRPGALPRLEFGPETGAVWNIELAEPALGIILEMEKPISEKMNWVVAGVRGCEYAAFPMEVATSSTIVAALPIALPAGRHQLELFFPALPGGSASTTGKGLVIRKIDAWDGDSDTVILAALLVPVQTDSSLSARELVVDNDAPAELATESLTVEGVPDAEIYFVLQHLEVRGLGDRSIRATVQAGKMTSTLVPNTEFLAGRAMSAAILPAIPDDGRLAIRLTAPRGSGRRVYNPKVRLDAPIVFAFPDQ